MIFFGGIGALITLMVLGFFLRNFGAIVVLAIIGGGIFFALKFHGDREYQQTTEQADVGKVEIRNFAATRNLEQNGQASSDWSVSGLIKNGNERDVRAILLRLKLLDCSDYQVQAQSSPGRSCETFGNSILRSQVEVPPGEVRYFSGKVNFTNLPTTLRDPRISFVLEGADMRR